MTTIAVLAMVQRGDSHTRNFCEFLETQRFPERGYDVSHRGDLPGFVKAIDPHTIRWPEFPGNSMFNTLGNLLHDPHAGVVIPDFTRNRVVQVTGRAVALRDQPDPVNETAGARRFVEFTHRTLEGTEFSLESELGISRLFTVQSPGAGRMKLSVSKIEPLTEGIKRFEFHHPDGNALPKFEAGAHVEIAVLPELKRRYSLVSDPEDLSYYAIAVRRHESGKG
jgi:hypothetical protein